MAMHKMIQPYRDIDVGVHEVPIQGQLICAQIEVDDSDLMVASKSDDEAKHLIKMQLAQKIAEYMFDKGMVEYSIQDNGPAYCTKTVRARAFVTPDNQVRLLKIHAK